MTILARIHGMTGIATARIGPGLYRMEKFKIPIMHPCLHRIPPLVTIHAKHGIHMTLGAGIRIGFGINLMLGEPVGLMVSGLGGVFSRVAACAILRSWQGGIGIVVTVITSHAVDFCRIGKRIGIFMAEIALHLCRFKEAHMHFVREIKFLLRPFFRGAYRKNTAEHQE